MPSYIAGMGHMSNMTFITACMCEFSQDIRIQPERLQSKHRKLETLENLQ